MCTDCYWWWSSNFSLAGLVEAPGAITASILSSSVELFKSSEKAKVSSILSGGSWNWPHRIISEGWGNVSYKCCASSIAPYPWSIWFSIWLSSACGMYIAKSALMQLSVPSALAPWFKHVWGEKHVRRDAFFLRLACRKRLNTKDSSFLGLLKWNQDVCFVLLRMRIWSICSFFVHSHTLYGTVQCLLYRMADNLTLRLPGCETLVKRLIHMLKSHFWKHLHTIYGSSEIRVFWNVLMPADCMVDNIILESVLRCSHVRKAVTGWRGADQK